MKQQPAWTLRQNSNPDIEGYGRQNAKREHPPPISTANKHRVHNIREQDAHRNGKLIQSNQSAAKIGRGNLTNVERRGIRSDPDRDPDRDSSDDQSSGARRYCTEN